MFIFKKLLATIALFVALLLPAAAQATTLFPTGGGTGSSTLSGILIGNGVAPVNSLIIGTGLSLIGTTLTSTAAGSTFGTTSISATSPLSWNTSTANLSIQQASGSQNGFLSSTDWTTFNNKQAAGNYITALTGDGTASGPNSVAFTLATVNSNIGTFNNLTVNAKGLVTAASNIAYDTFGYPFPSNATTSALTLGGLTLSNLVGGGTLCLHVNNSGILSTAASDCGSGSGGVTGVTATNPLFSSGGTSPNITTIFSTTTTFGLGNNGFLITGATGIPFVAASSTLDLPTSALASANISQFTNNSGYLTSLTGAASSTLLGDSNTFSGAANTFTNLITGSISGNAGTATKLATGRTISITGDLAYTSPSFDGSGNVTAAGTLATVNSNVGTFTYPSVTVNGKGLVTAISNGTAPTTYTGIFPIQVTGSAISSLFSTTTNSGMAQGFQYVGSGGIFQTAASSSLFGFTPQPAGSYITALTGDGTASGPGSAAFTLATVNSNIGTFNNITINAKGLATAGSNIVYDTFAWPFTPVSYGNATSSTIGFTNGILVVGSSTIVGNATTTGMHAFGNVRIPSLGVAAGQFAALDPNGVLIGTTTPINTGGSSEGVQWATAAVLGGTPTYSNGTLGVGATLTEIGTGALSVDGNAPVSGDRVLVKNQASAFQNGIYVVTATGSGIASYILTRSTDYNSNTEITPGLTTYVVSGTANLDTTWAVSFTVPLTMGTTNLNYTEVSGGGAAVVSVSNSDSTLTITPTTGNVVASLNLGHANVWSALQTFSNASSTLFSTTYASSTNYFGANLVTCTGTSAVTWSAGLFGCTAIPQGTLTAVTGTFPVISSGGATPNITFGGLSTTTNLVIGQVPYSTGVNTFGQVATTSITNGSGIGFTGTAGALLGGSSLTITNTGVTSVAVTSPITTSGSTGGVTLGCASCLTANQTITLSGDVSGSGTTAITTTIGALKVLGSMIANATIDLTTKVTGILPIANGGTNNSSFTTGAIDYFDGSKLSSYTNSFINAPAGWLGIGTSTPHWLNDFASSTAPQLALTSASATGNFHWTVNNIFGNLFFATSSDTTFATSTNADTNIGFIEFPSNGGCVGCTDILLPDGINLRNAKYITATTTINAANTFETIYTVPAGRRALFTGFDLSQYSTSGMSYRAFATIAGINYGLTASSSGLGAQDIGLAGSFVLNAGESITFMQSLSGGTNIWVNLIEYDASVPFYSARAFNPTSNATTTLYTVPTGSSALLTGANVLAPSAIAGSVFYCTENVSTGSVERLSIVKSGQTALTNVNTVNKGVGCAAGTYQASQISAAFQMLNSGDSFTFTPTVSVANAMIWINVYEH